MIASVQSLYNWNYIIPIENGCQASYYWSNALKIKTILYDVFMHASWMKVLMQFIIYWIWYYKYVVVNWAMKIKLHVLCMYACQIYFVECVSKIKHILSAIHWTICGALWFQFTQLPCDNWENIYTLSYYHHQIGSMNYYPLFRVMSWNNGLCCMSFYNFMINVCI